MNQGDEIPRVFYPSLIFHAFWRDTLHIKMQYKLSHIRHSVELRVIMLEGWWPYSPSANYNTVRTDVRGLMSRKRCGEKSKWWQNRTRNFQLVLQRYNPLPHFILEARSQYLNPINLSKVHPRHRIASPQTIHCIRFLFIAVELNAVFSSRICHRIGVWFLK